VEAVVDVEGPRAVLVGGQGGLLNLADGRNGISYDFLGGQVHVVLSGFHWKNL